MKNFRKFIALMMTLLIALGSLSVVSFAADDSVSVKMLNFNVAGLPNVKGILGIEDVSVSNNQQVTAAYMNSNDFDIVAVQEDFNYHNYLDGSLDKSYNVRSNHSGSFLGGDGLNVFTKDITIYNETRVPWGRLNGVLDGGADELSKQGILYTVLDLGNGIYVDFYDIHADAYGTPGDREAREDNYKQLTDLIEANSAQYDRPVIVTGDFNHFFHTTDEDNSHMRQYFLEKCGLKDAWIEANNGGDYNDFSKWEKEFADKGGYWGNWESVEKFLYRDGGGIKITVDSCKYTWVKNEKGELVSDHAANECEMTFTKTADFVPNAQELYVAEPARNNMFTEMIGFLTILFKLFANFDQVLALLG